MRRLAVVLVLVLIGASCAGDGGGSTDPSALTTVGRCEDIADLHKLREELTASAGRRVTVRPVGANGEAVRADPGECLRTTSPGVEIVAARLAADDPTVAILVDPGTDAAEASASSAAAIDVLESLAPDVDVGVFGLGPVDDSYSNPAIVSEPPAEWLVWASDEPPPAGSDRQALALDEGFVKMPSPIVSVPSEVGSGPVFARTNLTIDEAVDPQGVLFTGKHTGGLVLRVGGVEVLRSNLPTGDLGADSQPLDTASGTADFSVTLRSDQMAGHDTVVSIEWFGAAGAAIPPSFSFKAVDSRARPSLAAPLVGFGSDRAFAVTQIGRRDPRALAPKELGPAAAIVAAALDERNERSSDGPKVMLVVAPHRRPEALPDFGGDPLVIWIGDRSGELPAGVQRAEPDRPGVGDAVSALVEAHREAGVWAVGICGPTEPIEPVIEVSSTGAKTSPKLAATVGSGPCVAAEAVLGTPAATSVRLELTADQQRVFEQRDRDADRRPVAASLSLAAGVDIAAEVRIRGQSTVECDRKSYSVSLPERVAIPLFEGWHPSEFTLLSMCLDEGYVRTLTTFRLLESLGLSDLRMSLVDVVIGDRPQGVYLLIERADDLTEHAPTAVGVVRRRLDRSVQVSEVEWSRNQRPDLLLADYESVITFAEDYEGDDLVGELDERMDLDQYLRWLAVMSLVENGDYSDEVFFVGDPVARGSDLALRWHIQPWDPDDMFQPCHLGGVLEIPDAGQLTSCAESRLDAAILGDSAVHLRYQTQLADVLDRLTPQAFAETLAGVRAELDAALPDDPQDQMPELATFDDSVVDARSFVAALDRNDDTLTERFSARHNELGARVRERGGVPLSDEMLDQLTLRAPTRATDGGTLPVVVEARREDGSIDDSVSGLARLHVDGGQVDDATIMVRRGRGSTTLGPVSGSEGVTIGLGTNGPTRSIDPPVGRPRLVGGSLSGDDLRWGPDETIVVTGDTRVPAGSTLVIEEGTRVELSPRADLDVGGAIESRGSDDAPVVFGPLDADTPWGGVLHFSGSGNYEQTWFVGGGGNRDRAFRHSGSQPVVFAAGGADVTLDHVVVQDGPGKGPSGEASSVSISDSLITRLDTGGEFVDTDVSVERSWYLDFPTAGRDGDDDNDALYLTASRDKVVASTEARVSDSVFINGADDGIDQNGADVTLERLWIEGFAHECVAFSEAGIASLSDSVMAGCGQGVEVGYGKPQVSVDHVVVFGNDVGVRFGDEYDIPSTGKVTVENSIVLDNVADLLEDDRSDDAPPPDSIGLRLTIVGSAGRGRDGTLNGSVTFTDRLLLGPLSAGAGEADEGRDVGLLTARPR